MSEYKKICSKCIMDNTIPDLELNNDNICQYCRMQEEFELNFPIDEKLLEKICEKIRSGAKGKEFDCVAGTSGGADSTYALYIAKKFGLNPLVVHFDNGWNSEKAVHNIKNSLDKLGFQLKTYVVDWDEFKDIQLAFLKASVSDGEIPTDIGIRALLYKTANKLEVKHIITGSNFRTEGPQMPKDWTYMDGKYIKSVQREYGTLKIKSFPNITFPEQFYYNIFKKINVLKILNYVDYNKVEVKKILEKEIGWIDYGGKHFESTYTRFFQSYILYNKFNIDKRIPEYSALIRSGQLNRDEAIVKVKHKPYSENSIEFEIDYFCKKMSISRNYFEKIMSAKIKSYKDYKTHADLKYKYPRIYDWYKKTLQN